MDEKLRFNEEDKKKVVEYLNFVAIKANYNNINTKDMLDYYRMLTYMQTELLPKIEDNIFEVKEYVEKEEESN